MPSTVVNSTLVIDSTFCQNYPNMTTDQCLSLSGNTFNTTAAGTSYNASSSNVILTSNPVWTAITSSQSILAGDTLLQLPPDDPISEFPFGLVIDGDHQNVGHLGLATNSDFLRSAHCSNLIPSNGFGFNAGSQSIENPRDGSLTLGGYDLSSINGPFYTFPVGSTDSTERQCPFQVTITELAIRFPQSQGSTDIILTGPGLFVPACIEMYDNLFRLPETILESFQVNTDWNSSFKIDPNFLIDEPGLYYPQTKGFNGSLMITLSTGLVVEIPNEEMTNPLRHIDVTGARILEPNITEVNIFYTSAALNTATLGRKFLTQFYMAADYGNKQFMLAPIVANPAGPDLVAFNSTFPSCSKFSKSGSQTNLGLKIGVSLGVASLVFVIIAIDSCCLTGFIIRWLRRMGRKLRQGNSTRDEQNPPMNSQSQAVNSTSEPQSIIPTRSLYESNQTTGQGMHDHEPEGHGEDSRIGYQGSENQDEDSDGSDQNSDIPSTSRRIDQAGGYQTPHSNLFSPGTSRRTSRRSDQPPSAHRGRVANLNF